MTRTAAILLVFLAMLLMIVLPAQGGDAAPSEADIAAATAADLRDAIAQARAELRARQRGTP